MVSVLIKHAGSLVPMGRGGGAVCVCVRSTTVCIMDRAEVLRMKLTTLQLWLLFPVSHTHFHCSAKVIDCFYRMMYACLCVCLWSDRLTVHAQSQTEGVRQAGSSCIGTSLWGQRFPASLSLFPVSLRLLDLHPQRRDFHPHTHASFIADQFNTHQQAIDGCLSVRRNIQ